MKIALYIEDGLEQIVLTPETDTEKGILGKINRPDLITRIYTGGFYACQGGWTRQSSGKDSTIICLSGNADKGEVA